MTPPFMMSRIDILRSPTLKASKLSNSIVVSNRPKLCNAAKVNAKTATKRSQALLLINPEINLYAAHAPAALVKGRINSYDEIENLSTTATASIQEVSK